jgi:hypothetical protein
MKINKLSKRKTVASNLVKTRRYGAVELCIKLPPSK